MLSYLLVLGLMLGAAPAAGQLVHLPPPDPFGHDTPAQLAAHYVTLDTSLGTIVLSLLADKAPETVRQFLTLADAGVYDKTLVHRVAPNFVMQTGAPAYRQEPLTPAQQGLIHPLRPEFNDTPMDLGVAAMAHGDDPGDGTTSFFICIGSCHALDGKYTVFARVTGGMDVLQRIAAVPVDGETPRTPILVTHARVIPAK